MTDELSQIIVKSITDKIITDIIRPQHPVPEERECSEIADEITAITSELISLVTEILNADK